MFVARVASLTVHLCIVQGGDTPLILAKRYKNADVIALLKADPRVSSVPR